MNESRLLEMKLSQIQLCVLEYRSKDEGRAVKAAASPVVLLLWDQESSLRILIKPELNLIVSGDDRDYLESLLKDFRERSHLDPEALFKQVSSLSVGPLVANAVGASISDFPSILELCSTFVEL